MLKVFPSQKSIARDENEIIEDGEGQFVEVEDWESKIFLGDQIPMGIIIAIPTRRPA